MARLSQTLSDEDYDHMAGILDRFQGERAMNLQERMVAAPAGAKMDASVSRQQSGEQIRLMSEANDITRHYYEGHLQELRRQNSQATPDAKAAARK